MRPLEIVVDEDDVRVEELGLPPRRLGRRRVHHRVDPVGALETSNEPSAVDRVRVHEENPHRDLPRACPRATPLLSPYFDPQRIARFHAEGSRVKHVHHSEAPRPSSVLDRGSGPAGSFTLECGRDIRGRRQDIHSRRAAGDDPRREPPHPLEVRVRDRFGARSSRSEPMRTGARVRRRSPSRSRQRSSIAARAASPRGRRRGRHLLRPPPDGRPRHERGDRPSGRTRRAGAERPRASPRPDAPAG